MEKRWFKLEFNLASFEDPEEVKMVLTVIGMKVANGQTEGKVMDSSGNTAGQWEIN